MSRSRIYLDDNASAPLRACAREAALGALKTGNPSSVSQEGRAARRIVNEARESVAALAGVASGEVVFTSGASEANAMGLDPAMRIEGRQVTHLLVSAIEHPSVLWGGRFAEAQKVVLEVSSSGVVTPQGVRRALDELPEGAVPLVAVMAANNETGVVQPVAEIADIVRSAGGALHCDAVQAAGRRDLADLTEGADTLSLSGHKIGAPAGVGALVLRSGRVAFPRPLIGGGGQERNRRAGTENVAGIAGFGAAAREAAAERDIWAEIQRLREWIESRLRAISPAAEIIGAQADRLPNTICAALEGVQAETAVIGFDLEGIAISAGSACSSGKVGPSHVLTAMGIAEGLRRAALRISLTRAATQGEAEAFVAAWERICAPAAARQSAA